MPIKLLQLQALLKCYTDRLVAKSLAEGFEFDFRIPALALTNPMWADNLCSITGTEEVVRRKLGKEIKAGRVIGPFRELPLKNLRISPLDIQVPKKALWWWAL